MSPSDFSKRLKTWSEKGFKELGDSGRQGIGRTTRDVLRHQLFHSDPHQVCQ